MHLEFLVEDSSGATLLQALVPRILGALGEPHTWRVIAYKGIGHIPKKLGAQSDPAKRILLQQLPRLLRGYGNTPGVDAVVVVLDTDNRDCVAFLQELKQLADGCRPAPPRILFRLAIEEIEAWYLGDPPALARAYPQSRLKTLTSYVQDRPGRTWEQLADAVYPGGSAALKKQGAPLPGDIKHEWAKIIGPLLNLEQNKSSSFRTFRDGLRSLVASFDKIAH